MKRLLRICSVVLLVMLVVVGLLPSATAFAAYGQQGYQAQPIPSATGFTLAPGTDVTDLAMGSGIIYMINGRVDALEVPALTGKEVYKSIDGGQSWSKLTSPTSVGVLTRVAVAPDNVNVVAVCDATDVYISSDAGSSWSKLAGPGGGAAIQDLSVAPARSGTLLGREYFIATADVAAGIVGALGNVFIVGGATATFQSVFTANPGRDYVAVQVTPNFLGDRSIVTLGAGPAAGQVFIQVINTSATQAVGGTAVVTGVATTTDVGGVNGISRGAIALPADYDATTSSGRRAYVGWTSAGIQTDNDAYRVDDTTPRALSAGPTWSLSFAGTVSTGTLFKGHPTSIGDIKYTTDATSSSPTWTSTQKFQQPGAVATNIVVMAASDFASSKKVYAGTSDVESAFSISTNGGISFNQMSMIDQGVLVISVNQINSVGNGGSTVFMATKAANNNISVWKSPAPTADATWQRVMCVVPAVAANTGLIQIPPDYATTSSVYVLETASAGANIYRSSDAGETWNTRIPPTTTKATQGYQDSNIWYWADTSGGMYKTTNGGFTWGTVVSTTLTGIIQINIPKADGLIVGGIGSIATSNDGGTTYTKIDLDAGVQYRLTRDAGFATNNLLYLADNTATSGNVFQFKLGTDTKPTVITATPATTGVSKSTIFQRAGVLYVANNLAALTIDRSVNPTETPGTVAWTVMDTPVEPVLPLTAGVNDWGVTSTTDKDSIIYAYDKKAGNAVLLAYDDVVGSNVPKITTPAANINLAIDPNNGLGKQFTLVMAAIGSGNSLVNKYDVQITDNQTGWAAATTTFGIPVSNPTAPTIVVGGPALATSFQPNTNYLLRVRAADEVSGDLVTSPWSTPINISVQSGGQVVATQSGAVLLGPVGGAVNVSLTPGFAWAPINGATQYKFTLATDAGMTKTVAGTPANTTLPSFQVTTPLVDNTTYFWSVQAIAPTAGQISVSTFTTAPKAAPVTAQPTVALPPITVAAPVITIPPAPAPIITIPPAAPVPTPPTPAYVWAIIFIGAILVIAVIVLILRTRRTV